MLLATYEVLVNKENWHSYDSARRDVWTPLIGPLDAASTWFALQHQIEAPLNAQLYDPYGVCPFNLAASSVQLSDEFWPNRGPETTTAGGYQLSVIPRDRLAVTSAGTATTTPYVDPAPAS